MYAVIANGGKQYKVTEGQVIKLESMHMDAGSKVEFDQVILLADGETITLGSPYVQHATVSGEVVNNGRGEKINIIKFRRRKHHMKRMGHRQNYTAVKITGIISSKK